MSPEPMNRSYRRRKTHEYLGDRQGIVDILGTILKWAVLILAFMYLVSLSQQAYDIGYAIFSQKALAASGEGVPATVTVTDSMSVDDIGKELEKNGLIADGSIFKFQERFSSYHGQIKPGTYELSSDMTPEEMTGIMAGGVTAEAAEKAEKAAASESSVVQQSSDSSGENPVEAQ